VTHVRESLREFAAAAIQRAKDIPVDSPYRFTRSKVFLAALSSPNACILPPYLQNLLLEAHRAGLLSLSRIDLAQAANPSIIQTSRLPVFIDHQLVAEYHLISTDVPKRDPMPKNPYAKCEPCKAKRKARKKRLARDLGRGRTSTLDRFYAAWDRLSQNDRARVSAYAAAHRTNLMSAYEQVLRRPFAHDPSRSSPAEKRKRNLALLPKAALAKMSARQRANIDEFDFIKRSDDWIEAWYGGELLAVWGGKAWVNPHEEPRVGHKRYERRDPRRKKMRTTKARFRKGTLRRRDPGRGTRKQDEKYGDWSGIRESMTYGVLPSQESFDHAFDEEVPKGKYNVGNDPILGTDSFNASELWKVLEVLTEQFHEGDDQAGDTASSILYTLGFEWI
jgi:hypothetical protein